MPIPVVCPNGHKGRVRDELAGKRIKCPRCGDPIVVPGSVATGAGERPAPRQAPSDAPADASTTGADAQSGRRGMLRGYWIVLAGVIAFLALVALGNVIDPKSAIGDLLAYTAFSLLFVGFWLGAALIAIEKGYHAALGLGLGLIAPLGLLILTVMPDRAAGRT